jgi:acid phosphatase (class A)
MVLFVLPLASCGPPKTELDVKQKDALTFSNTQTWNSKYLDWAEKAPILPGVELPAVAANSSAETQEELRVLHGYQKSRTAEQVDEIKSEIDIFGARFGDKTLAEHFDEERRPNSFFLLAFLMQIESEQVMRLKKLHDRVRPSFLDPTLKTAIAVPAHPAYPSGHATQAFMRARVLGQLDPQNKEIYLQAAERIARNREIAGLHYPSDSLAGRVLADQLLTQLMQDPDFVTQFRLAKAEW